MGTYVSITADDRRVLVPPLGRVEIDGAFKLDVQKAVRSGAFRVESDSAVDLAAMVGLAPIALFAYFMLGAKVEQPLYWLVGGVILLVATGLVIARAYVGGVEVARILKQTGSFVLALLVAVGVPALAIWLHTGVGEEQLRAGAKLGNSNDGVMVFGRAVQWMFVSIASLGPALLFFTFDRQRLATQRERFIQNIFRLDPDVRSLDDIDAKYGPQMSEFYGTTPNRPGRLVGGRRSPVVVATILITIGWTLTLLNGDVHGTDLAVQERETWLLSLFEPHVSMLTFAFMGAYLYAMEVAVRGYLRGDLHPKSYGRITVRIVLVTVLAYVVGSISVIPAEYAAALGFVIGVFPEWAVRWIVEKVQKVRGGSADSSKDPELVEWASLTAIEGIDTYERARLIDEGVTNVEALAHHDLIDLILQTRIPTHRLLDWVDQAILHIHVDDALRKQLRGINVRTATDLLHLMETNPDSVIAALPGVEQAKARLTIITALLEREVWTAELIHWRTKRDRSRAPWEIDCRNDAEEVRAKPEQQADDGSVASTTVPRRPPPSVATSDSPAAPPT